MQAAGSGSRLLVVDAAATLGDLHTVVCNAGIDIIQPALDYAPEQWDRILDVNLRGASLTAGLEERRMPLVRSTAGHVGRRRCSAPTRRC